jgi:hypothetical protein
VHLLPVLFVFAGKAFDVRLAPSALGPRVYDRIASRGGHEQLRRFQAQRRLDRAVRRRAHAAAAVFLLAFAAEAVLSPAAARPLGFVNALATRAALRSAQDFGTDLLALSSLDEWRDAGCVPLAPPRDRGSAGSAAAPSAAAPSRARCFLAYEGVGELRAHGLRPAPGRLLCLPSARRVAACGGAPPARADLSTKTRWLSGGLYAVSASGLSVPERTTGWDDAREAEYVQMGRVMARLDALRRAGRPEYFEQEPFAGFARQFDALRWERLRGWLESAAAPARGRPLRPVAVAGHSIFVFDLSDEQIEEATGQRQFREEKRARGR